MRVLVCGGTGFVGGHLVQRLLDEGHDVTAADIQPFRYGANPDCNLVKCDLRDPLQVASLFEQPYDEVYQLAADMGGAGYIFTGENDASIMRNSALVNMNILDQVVRSGSDRVFYSSSACIYPQENQTDPDNPHCAEDTAYPAHPDSEYGWEKLFSERIYLASARNEGIKVRIARYHNIFGPLCAWNDGKEKAPAALARKVAETPDNGEIEIWGDGKQSRSFLYVDECLEGTIRLMRSDFEGPVNIGSDEMVTISGLADMFINLSGKKITKRFVPGPQGVRGRNSDNNLIREKLGWAPSAPLIEGLTHTYAWISEQVGKKMALSA